MNIALLKSLSEAAGVPGREERVREIIRKNARGIFDDISIDPMGSLIATKRGASKSAKRVLLACHIDEIGFYVKHVDDKGFLRVQNVGQLKMKFHRFVPDGSQIKQVVLKRKASGWYVCLMLDCPDPLQPLLLDKPIPIVSPMVRSSSLHLPTKHKQDVGTKARKSQ